MIANVVLWYKNNNENRMLHCVVVLPAASIDSLFLVSPSRISGFTWNNVRQRQQISSPVDTWLSQLIRGFISELDFDQARRDR